jgi:hypothetical protein
MTQAWDLAQGVLLGGTHGARVMLPQGPAMVPRPGEGSFGRTGPVTPEHGGTMVRLARLVPSLVTPDRGKLATRAAVAPRARSSRRTRCDCWRDHARSRPDGTNPRPAQQGTTPVATGRARRGRRRALRSRAPGRWQRGWRHGRPATGAGWQLWWQTSLESRRGAAFGRRHPAERPAPHTRLRRHGCASGAAGAPA